MNVALLLSVAAVGVAAAQVELTTGRTAVAGGVALVALTALVHPRRLHLGSAGEVLAAIVLGGAGTVIHGLAPEQTGLGSAPLRSAVFVFAFTGLAMAALRLHLDRAEGGLPGTLAAAGVAFLACGTVRSGPWLPRLFGVYLLLAFVALAVDAWRRGRAPAPWRLRGRHALASLVLVAVVPALMWAWGVHGPRLIRTGAAAFFDLFGPLHRTGFHDGPISLSALDGISESDAVVMRIDGDVGGHLRGNVYLTYERGHWVPAADGVELMTEPMEAAHRPGSGTAVVRIEYVSDETDHYFLPLGARPFATEPDVAVVDPWQLVRADASTPVAAELTIPGGPPLEPAMPSPLDLAVPETMRAALEASSSRLVAATLAEAGARARFEAGVGLAPAEHARRLEAALATRFDYSTDFREAYVAARSARPRVDPVVIFLEDMQTGHCEYFASALALMLRVEGIPARMVSGYRVAEWNELGGWAVVRERHAHAWVEAYLPDAGWTTLDGTPLAASTADQGLAITPRFAALVDWLSRQARVHGRTALLVVLVASLAGVQIVRLVRGRSTQGGDDRAAARRISKALQSMLARLAEAGFDRARGESLESLARRLRAPDGAAVSGAAPAEPAFVEAAELLDRYAALRYGDVGHGPTVEAGLAAWPEPVDQSSG